MNRHFTGQARILTYRSVNKIGTGLLKFLPLPTIAAFPETEKRA